MGCTSSKHLEKQRLVDRWASSLMPGARHEHAIEYYYQEEFVALRARNSYGFVKLVVSPRRGASSLIRDVVCLRTEWQSLELATAGGSDVGSPSVETKVASDAKPQHRPQCAACCNNSAGVKRTIGGADDDGRGVAEEAKEDRRRELGRDRFADENSMPGHVDARAGEPSRIERRMMMQIRSPLSSLPLSPFSEAPRSSDRAARRGETSSSAAVPKHMARRTQDADADDADDDASKANIRKVKNIDASPVFAAPSSGGGGNYTAAGSDIAYDDDMDRELRRFPARCPPRGGSRLVVYTTSLRGIRKTFDDCGAVRAMLRRGGAAWIDERDVSMHAGFLDELRELVGGIAATVLPRVFVRGRYIGGVDEVRRLDEAGELARLVAGLPSPPVARDSACCAGVRFVPCPACRGSRKLRHQPRGPARLCPLCNENGLIRCPACSA